MQKEVAPVDLSERVNHKAIAAQERARSQIRNIIWRDKLNLHIGMDCVTLLDKLSAFFDEVQSFELDPSTG